MNFTTTRPTARLMLYKSLVRYFNQLLMFKLLRPFLSPLMWSKHQSEVSVRVMELDGLIALT